MKKFILGAALCITACSEQMVPLGPNDAQMREAYLATGNVLLGNDLLGGDMQLTEFKKIGCNSRGQGLFHCKFYAKFGVLNSTGDRKIIDHLVGSQSGYFREATFFLNAERKWVCADVTDSPLRESGMQAGAVGNE